MLSGSLLVNLVTLAEISGVKQRFGIPGKQRCIETNHIRKFRKIDGKN